MSDFFDMGSLALGAISWIIPVFAISQYRKGNKLKNVSIYSVTFCACAIVFQLLQIRHRVNNQDFSGIMDTIGAVSVVSVILVVITFVLNITATCLIDNENK